MPNPAETNTRQALVLFSSIISMHALSPRETMVYREVPSGARGFRQIAIEQGGTLKVEYLDSDAWGTTVDQFHLTPVVRVGDLVFISGASGGSHSADPEEQFTAAFQDIADTLAAVGVGWDEVVKMTTYHQGGLRQNLDLLLQVKDRFVRPPYPAWTGVGVTELANPHALIEIDVIAVVTA